MVRETYERRHLYKTLHNGWFENPEYKYSLAFLGFEGGNPGQAEIELTYNWGVENYDHGNVTREAGGSLSLD